MSGRILIVKNIEREGLGLLRSVLHENDVEADCIEMNRGDVIPSLDPYSALVIFGGPQSANDDSPAMRSEIATAKEALRTGLPFLGICLGHQVLGRAAGATVETNSVHEAGTRDHKGAPYTVELTDAGRFDPLFDEVNPTFPVFQLHGEAVKPFTEIEILGTGEHCEVQVIRVGRRAYGLQMHVELTPEMLATWIDQDDVLGALDGEAMQADLAAISEEYNSVGRRILTNFLSLAGIASSVELDLGEADVR